jgi:H+/Cl- antiporter ClcA
MLATPSVPVLPPPSHVSLGSFSGVSFHVTFDPVILTVLLALVGIFVAMLSVMLIYHWRKFPFEQDLFRRVERGYLLGIFVLCTTAVVGILIA